MVELSLERRMREAEVGSQSADTIKLSFRSQLFEMAGGLIRPLRSGVLAAFHRNKSQLVPFYIRSGSF